jgi:hypothetical protein
MYEYHVDAFIPNASGCGKTDTGWDPKRCSEFTAFLNNYSEQGYKLHSCEYRSVSVKAGCGNQSGSWLVCVFEREKN